MSQDLWAGLAFLFILLAFIAFIGAATLHRALGNILFALSLACAGASIYSFYTVDRMQEEKEYQATIARQCKYTGEKVVQEEEYTQLIGKIPVGKVRDVIRYKHVCKDGTIEYLDTKL